MSDYRRHYRRYPPPDDWIFAGVFVAAIVGVILVFVFTR